MRPITRYVAVLSLLATIASFTTGSAADEPWPAEIPGHVSVRPGEHPRLLFRRADLPALRDRAGTAEGRAIIERLRLLLNGGDGRAMPTAYNPVVGPASKDGSGATAKAPPGMYTFSHAAGYGLLYQLTGERLYADLGRQCMEKALEGTRDRDNRYAFKFPYGALRAGPSLGWTALGYDLCYDGWDEDFRRRMTDALFNYEGRSPKRSFDLEYLVEGKRHFPASNHWGMQVGGGALAVLAVMGDPGTDPARIEKLLATSEKSMLRLMTEGFGDGGYFAEGDGTGSMASHIVFLTALQAWKNAAGKDFIGPRPNAQWMALKWFLQTIPRGGDARGLAKGFVARGGYPHNVWARDGISGGGYFAIGYGAVTKEQVPALWWFYDRYVKDHDERSGTPWDTVSPYPHHAVLASVNTPFGQTPVNPAECIPRQVRDTKHGFFAFRNRWKDEDDIVITQLTRRSPARFKHGPDRAMTIQHHGRREKWGSIPRDVSYLQAGRDGSAIVGDGDTFLAIDFSGASGADGMLVMTGPGSPPEATVEAGGRTFALKFLTDGAPPTPTVEGARIVIGDQTVSMRDGRLVLARFAAVRTAPTEDSTYDVVVYGGTSAGVVAAVQAHRMGKSVIVVCPEKHLGGLSAGGLGWTDTGNKAVIGGLAREFYHRVWRHYQKPEAWKWQKRSEYGNRGQGTAAIDGDARTMWIFEPHVAEQVFEDLVAEHEIPVHRGEWLDRRSGVKKDGPHIVSITTLGGRTYRGRMFIDATYEGDLMAAAGIDYHVGREANSVYGETWNGVQVGVLHHGHWFKKSVSPYVVAGDPSSGLLPRVSPDPPGKKGAGDRRIQAYCFRMCLTTHPGNRVPFAKPEGYDRGQYELLARVLATGWREVFQKFDPIPNGKTDTNNHGPFSTDNIGYNYDYPEGSYERRRKIIAEHERYQRGLMYYLANDPAVPADVRTEMSRWGLAKDEFTDNDNWPHQIYVREARRMIGSYVMTEHDCLARRRTPEPVGMGSYTMDSHNVQRYVKPDGYVQNEGDIGVSPPRPYQIAYGSLTPKKSQCENLLVPVCVSSSHIAFGSIRMEPVFMILAQSAATAAVMSLEAGVSVQDLPYPRLRARLLEDGQVLESRSATRSAGARSVPIDKLPGVVVDETKAEREGGWTRSASIGPYVQSGYHHDNNSGKGTLTARFEAKLEPGRYEVRVCYSAHQNRATNVPVTVRHAGGSTTVRVNQRKKPTLDAVAVRVGEFEFSGTGTVEISNGGTDGYVVVDAVLFVGSR